MVCRLHLVSLVLIIKARRRGARINDFVLQVLRQEALRRRACRCLVLGCRSAVSQSICRDMHFGFRPT